MNTIAPKPVGHDWRGGIRYDTSMGGVSVDFCRRCGMTRRYGAGLTVEYSWASGPTTITLFELNDSEPPCSADEAGSTDKDLLSPQEG